DLLDRPLRRAPARGGDPRGARPIDRPEEGTAAAHPALCDPAGRLREALTARRSPARSDPALPHHLPLAGVDRLQRADPLLRHLVAHHAVALGRELLEVDPDGVVRARPVAE